jgi:pyruvate dehydrogenase E1 component alpha subunit
MMREVKPLDLQKSALDHYRAMLLIRRVEEEIIRLYPSDNIKSPVHLSIGQESVAVGVCAALQPRDTVFGTYRGHALYLAKGGDVRRMMAELYGKVDGAARGKAGSMHLIDMAVNMMGTSAIVATSIPNAVGYALAEKMRGRDAVTVVFFGDGATDEGVFHESMNFAALKKLPILFVCENNFYAIYSPLKDRMAGDFEGRASAYAMPYRLVEDHQFGNVLASATELVDRIRAGGGPQFLECHTYRWRDHVGPDEDRVQQYRPDAELEAWIARDPLRHLEQQLAAADVAAVRAEIEETIASAVAAAEASSFPAADEVFDYVYAR